MDMKQIYKKLQEFFSDGRTAEAEDFLIEMMKQAQQIGDYNSLIMLLNEMIGLCRESGQKDKSLAYGGQVLQLMQQLGMQDSEAYATTLLNVATACRAAGKHVEAYQFYMEVFPLYEKWLEPGDWHFASLYNNMSLLFQETGEYERAAECQGKALAVLEAIPGRAFEGAVTHANLATTLCRIAEQEESGDIAGQAAQEAMTAIQMFDNLGVNDVHSAAALAAYGDAMILLKDWERASDYYEEALARIERLVGRTESYERVKEKLEHARGKQAAKQNAHQTEEKPQMRGLDIARAYYEEIGKPVLMRDFPEYFERMAIGLCGEGSDCLGFDDVLSMDHDYGPGFCIWLSGDDYAKIGEAVKSAYDALPQEWNGYRRSESAQGSGRTGVMTYEGYFERVLGMDHLPQTEAEWIYVPEYALRAAVSGEVFHDPQGTFSGMLSELKKHYPDLICARKKMQEFVSFEQCGPYNYPRMAQRGDMAAANLLLAEAVEHAAKLLYLSRKTYAPHKKWLLRGLEELATQETVTLLRELAKNLSSDRETVSANIERIRQLMRLLGEEMKEQLVDEIVKMEWEAFDHVKNEGGRASCQDDWLTFEIMRKSQYLTWSSEMLMQYREDFSAATARGWNPITEKYARMMESTTPEEYEKLRDELPEISEEKKEIMEGIIAIQVSWMEAFAEKYPKVAGNARAIHASEDTPYRTSYETYLRGELGTYSDTMLLLYGAFVAGLAREGENLAYLTMEQTVHMYGYADIETAEQKMW